MDTSYELWNVESGNIIGAFDTASEALAVVRHLLDSFGESYASELTLGRRDGDSPATIVGEGDELIAMMERPTTDAERDPVAATRVG
ncbi:MAG: hypothetical protein M3464_07065 [Chloroflexota bacterium]|nr:hypothetical protein [Chloroflexota bacterium]